MVERAWTAAQSELRRPAGGLAPGAGWRADGISWTPETALFALTAAHLGRGDVAAHWLDWLDAHRTDAGALPEKVLADGSPASVAPLAWTAALVVLTVAELDGRREATPTEFADATRSPDTAGSEPTADRPRLPWRGRWVTRRCLVCPRGPTGVEGREVGGDHVLWR
jgi:hypothetical protein